MTSMANDDDQKPLTLYSDMVGDLFHFGHVCFLKKARAILEEKCPGRSVRIVVGLVGDKTAEGYKRKPILSLTERAGLVRELSLVDEVIEDCPLVTSAAFMDKHGIDFVAHGDDYDPESNEIYYGDVVKRNAMIFVPYTRGISTSDIIRRCYERFVPKSPMNSPKKRIGIVPLGAGGDLGGNADPEDGTGQGLSLDASSRGGIWHKIWERKGKASTASIHHINGFNHQTRSQYKEMCEIVLAPLNIKKNDRVLDCGCGAGAFLLELQKLFDVVDITGVDYSAALIERANLHLNGKFYCGSIANMQFLKSNAYDVVVSFSVFHYLENEAMALASIKEFVRVAKPGAKIYIGDVNDLDKADIYHSMRKETHQKSSNTSKHVSKTATDHLLLPQSFFVETVCNEIQNVKIVSILDHCNQKFAAYYPCSPYRYSVYLEKLK